MTSHPWLVPSAATVGAVSRARATAILRQLATVATNRLGAYAAAWPPFVAALPALLQRESNRVCDVAGRVDVLPVLEALLAGPVAGSRIERALLVLWLGIAGHPGLAGAPLALPGPFRERVVDPCTPRLLAFGDVRGLAATARGPVVIGRAGRQRVDEFVVAEVPVAGSTVIVDERCQVPPPEVVARARAALALVGSALPAGRLERVTVGAGDAVCGEARVDAEADAAGLVASAQAAFVRAAAASEPLAGSGGTLVETGLRLSATEVLARAAGHVVALPWRADRAAAATAIADDLDEVAALAELTAAGVELVAAIRAPAAGVASTRRRALLVNVDADDFVYSFQFGRSIERRCAKRGLRLDRIAVDPAVCGDIAAELGQAVPRPIADGTELLIGSEQDSSLTDTLHRLASRRYEVVVANVRPRVFHDLLAGGLLAAPTLIWDRHLHGGLREEGDRRGVEPGRLHGLRARAWSLANQSQEGLQPDLARAGFARGSGHTWPVDLEFFRSTATPQPNRLFAGGDNGRDWPLFAAAVRDLPFDVHLVTREPPPDLPRQVRVDTRLTLHLFRDAMAAAAVTAIPLMDRVAAGITVIPMAMALGVAIVATRSNWTEQYVTDGQEALLVPAGDVGAFRAALLRLFEDAALRARLVANARRKVAALCDLEAFTAEMFAALESDPILATPE